MIGALLNFTSINPISALYYSAVINGVAAVPVLVAMMILGRDEQTMGQFRIQGPLFVLGWMTVAVMALATIAMIAEFFLN